jgi:YVTN family beta-propeller protein
MSPHAEIIVALTTLLAAPQPQGPTDIRVIVANKQEATASIIDAGTGATTRTVPTGAGPHEVAVSRNGRQAVVTNYGDGPTPGSSLTLIDLASGAAKTIGLGEYRRPHGVAFLPGDMKVAVTVEANQAVLVVDLARGAVERTISTAQGGSHMIALRADGLKGYTANVGSGSITEIDFVSGATRSLAIAPQTEGIGVTPDGSQVWVGSNQNNTVTVVDVASWKPIATLVAPGLPYRINISPDGKRAVVTTPMANTVRVFDVATRNELAAVAIPGDAQPVGAAISTDSKWAFVACQGTRTAAVIDLQQLKVEKSMPTGAGPDGIATTGRTPG